MRAGDSGHCRHYMTYTHRLLRTAWARQPQLCARQTFRQCISLGLAQAQRKGAGWASKHFLEERSRSSLPSTPCIRTTTGRSSQVPIWGQFGANLASHKSVMQGVPALQQRVRARATSSGSEHQNHTTGCGCDFEPRLGELSLKASPADFGEAAAERNAHHHSNRCQIPQRQLPCSKAQHQCH